MENATQNKIESFMILLPNGEAIGDATRITKGGKQVKLDTPEAICRFIKAHFLKANNVRSFTQWAEELNADPDYEGNCLTKADALDSLANTYTLNIDGRYVDLYAYFTENLPFNNQ